MKQSFFHHTAMETAIRNGWDFEQNLTEFYNTHERGSAILGGVVWEIKGLQVTESDVLCASCGTITHDLYLMFSEYLKGVKTSAWDIEVSPVVLQSMHSGSSDYLFLKDIKELVDEYKNKE